MLFDSASGRRRVVHALIFTAVYSGHLDRCGGRGESRSGR
jgi:hypothetical protein